MNQIESRPAALRHRQVQGLLALLIVAMVPLQIGGCLFWGLGAGVWEAESDPTLVTTATRVEAEFIPRAELVLEDTMPKWQAGRHAFAPGADRLLVVSRITSYIKKGAPAGVEGEKATTTQPADKVERVWITIPYGTPLGKDLRLEDLEDQHQAGYDEQDIGQGFYRMPYNIKGWIALLEEQPDKVVVKLDMNLVPKRMPAWQLAGPREVAITTTGIWAKPADTGVIVYKASTYKLILETKARKPAATEPADTVEAPASQPATPPPVAVAPHPSGSAPTTQTAATTQRALAAVAGKWIGTLGQWESRWQFDPGSDTPGEPYGKFTFATTKGGNPIVHQGNYTVQPGTVMLHITGCYELKPDNARTDSMYLVRKNWVGLKITSDENGLSVQGDLRAIGFEGDRLQLRKADYADMKISPPSGHKTSGAAGT